MEHLGADANLCAKAKLKAVRKSGRCVDIDAGGVHLIQKCPGMRFVVRDDCFGMSGVVAVDIPIASSRLLTVFTDSLSARYSFP